jgi:hypothetical protein
MKSVRDVRIVAVLFLIVGVASVVELVRTRDLGLIGGLLPLFIGIGLLRYSNVWRIVALVTLWIALAGFLVTGAAALTGKDVVVVTSLGSSPVLLGALLLASLALIGWQIRVLTRADVRRSFELGNPAA